MKRLDIEWLHYAKEGETCDRCAATGTSVREVIALLQRELADQGVIVSLTETELPEEEMARSNLIRFNGISLEELLDGAWASENSCCSCSGLTGRETSCRTVAYGGSIYEEIPPELIRRAALKALELTGA